MDTFKALISAWLTVLSAILIEYLLKFRPGLPEKYVLKRDCQDDSEKLHKENREDHQLIFQRLDKISDQQTLILRELGKKADR